MMRSPRRFETLRIIGALLLAASTLLAGCSMLRTVGLQQAPALIYWRLDSYFDFDAEQAPRVRDAIARWFRWHRETQLPDYIALVGRARAQLGEPATPAAACRWWGEIGDRFDLAIDRAVPELAPVALTLTPAQLGHLERRYAKSIDEMRRDFLQGSADERRRAAVKRALERFEMFYGRLDDEQRKRVAAGAAASPFDAERFIAERSARQNDSVALLRRLQREQPPADAAVASLRELTAKTQTSPRPAYRAYQQQLIEYNCAFAAEIHNLTTPAQRQKAGHTLAGWEADLRALANGS